MIGAIQTAIATMATVVADLGTHTAAWTSALATKLNANADTTISSRASATNLATVDTVVDAIKAVTDTLPAAMLGRTNNAVVDGLMSAGTGIDAAYIDVTVTARTDWGNTICQAYGLMGSSTGPTTFASYPFQARMTSSTNVRVSHFYKSGTQYFSGSVIVYELY